jgi:predicted RNA binding protein YcfA (HicA-like mRNA interferase family)
VPDLARILDMLERANALEIETSPAEPSDDDGESAWPSIEADEAILEVDYGRLFPTRNPVDRGREDFEVYGDNWEISEDDAGTILDGIGGDPAESRAPEWDIWAWYQPIHFFGPTWGIYIRETGLIECARRIGRALPPGLATTYSRGVLAKAVVRAAFSALYLHEQYHHKTESAALRMHVVERRAIYPDYHRKVYRTTAGTKDQIEEGLANADAWYRITENAYTKWTGRTVTRATRDYLERSFLTAPPGYANAAALLGKDDFETEQQLLWSQVQEGLAPTRATPSEFGIATHLNHSLFGISQRIWTIVPAGGRSILPSHPAIAPLATSRLERLIKRNGWSEVAGAGKGSHRKFRHSDGRMIILPNTKDASRPVLKTTADALGVRVRELEELARSA